MRYHGHCVGVGIVVGLAGFVLSFTPASVPSGSSSLQAREQQVLEAFGKLPLYFVENQGQLDSCVNYYIEGRDKTIYFTPGGVTLALRAPDPEASEEESSLHPVSYRGDRRLAPEASERRGQRWVVKLDFVNANPDAVPQGQDPTPAVISYFKGLEEDWKAGLPTYASLIYEDLWPGIDLVYRGSVNHLKYTFLVHPGADPDQIRLAYRGAEVELDPKGQLQVSTPAGGFEDEKPLVYQEAEDGRQEVAAGYVLEGETGTEGQVYGFRLGAFDRSRALIIDPATLVYAGYIGGASDDLGFGIAVDGAGNVFVTGCTLSSEASFPIAVGPDLTHNGGFDDAFVAKVNAAGTALVYVGYIGGGGQDVGRGIAVDGAGNAYVTGATASSEASFPIMVGPDLTHAGRSEDAFVAKVNASGTGLLYAGYIGGTGSDGGGGIAVDGAGNAYVTGWTDSSESSFPITVGPDLTQNGDTDAFVAKVDAGGTALVYAGYIGGSGFEQGRGIAVDGAGHAYVTGSTLSSEASFPITVGPDLTYNGSTDAFVAKVNAGGTVLDYGGYIGGSGSDQGHGIAVDGAGNAYVTGSTSSSESSFLLTVGPDLTFNGGGSDAYVAKVNAVGTALLYAGYIGGGGTDVGFGIAVDETGNTYLTGVTSSSESSFPVSVGPDLTFNGGSRDAYVAKIDAGGTGIDYAGYIGGSVSDTGQGIAVDGAGNAYITGHTTSSALMGFPARVGPDLTLNGENDAFVAKMPSLSGDEIVPHIAVGGVWTTIITLVNTGEASVSFPLRFWTTAGTPWTVFVENFGTASEFTITLPAGGSTDLVLPSQDGTIRTGWAEIEQQPGNRVAGHAIFTDRTPGRPAFEAVVPLADKLDSNFLLPFDTTNGNNTCLALANSSRSDSTTVTLDFSDQSAKRILLVQMDVAARNQRSFCLANDFPLLAGRKGVLTVSGSQSRLSALAFRFNAGGAFTTFFTMRRATVPAFGVMPHIAVGGVWTTTVTFVNLGDEFAVAPLCFWTPEGDPWAVFIEGRGTSSSFGIVVPPGGSVDLVLPSQDGTIRTGWAEIEQQAGAQLAGHAVFADQTQGRPVFEAVVPLVDPEDTDFLLPFDNTGGNNTCLAVANSSGTEDTTVSFDTTDGSLPQVLFFPLFPRNQTSLCMVNGFPAVVATGKGVLEVNGSGPKLSALAFRFNPGGAFTTFFTMPR